MDLRVFNTLYQMGSITEMGSITKKRGVNTVEIFGRVLIIRMKTNPFTCVPRCIKCDLMIVNAK